MTLKDIKKAVNTALKKKYPDIKVYGADTVEGYTKPSFFVYATQTFSESTKNAFHRNVEVEIDYIQKSANEADGMDFFTGMTELFGQKLEVGNRSLNTSNIYLNFEGENQNIPVCTFEVEFWDAIPKTDNSKLMEEIEISQEVSSMGKINLSQEVQD